jgi:U3 small nucleolar RNA-associated protein MPP10
VTEETNRTLEDVIRQRIRDRAFDDVERKVRPKERPFKPREELSQEKSKLGLAEIYEREFTEKAEAAEAAQAAAMASADAGEGDPAAAAAAAAAAVASKLPEELKRKHKEIAKQFASLCFSLDSCANFYFTPRPPQPELEVRADAPAIAMEEVVPMGVSTAQTRAPEETFRSEEGGAPVAKDEMERAERRARFRAKKAARKTTRRREAAEERAQAKVDPAAARRLQAKEAAKAAKTLARKSAAAGGGGNADTTRYTNSAEFFARAQRARESREGATRKSRSGLAADQ